MTDAILALFTLTLMEVALGIDNVVFLSLLVGSLPPERQRLVRFVGLGLALGARVLLLLGVRFVMGLDTALFHLSGIGVPAGWVKSWAVDAVTGHDLVMVGGGMFLLAKSVREIHKSTEGDDESPELAKPRYASTPLVIAQVVVLDVVFSLDSVISAVGMARDLWVMITAMTIAIAVMAFFSGKVTGFLEEHPTMKMLALSFLVLVGIMLVAEGLGTHISRGYIYAAMVFSLGVELLNMRAAARKRARRVRPAPALQGFGPNARRAR